MKSTLIFLLCFSSLFSAATIQQNNINLGEARVYHSYKGENKVELTLVRLGKRSDKMVLISFNVPGHEMHKKSFVYDEKCETTRCNKIFFTQRGGKMINLIADKGYWGQGLQALLPSEDRKISLYYDEDLSKTKSRVSLFNEYLNDIYRDIKYSEIKLLLKESIQNFNKSCGGNAALETNIPLFKNKIQAKLLGMGKPMIDQIARTCEDPMYKEIFAMIKKITFKPSEKKEGMILTKMNELIIYLSPDLYNPTVTAKYDIDKL